MARTSEETKEKIRAAYESEKFTAKKIAERYGVSVATVYNICKGSQESAEEEDDSSEEVEAEETESDEEEVSEGSAEYWEKRANFWKQKYLETWADVVELGAD